MSNRRDKSTNKVEEPRELNPLMEAYNPEPPQAGEPLRFYWQEPWHEASADPAGAGRAGASATVAGLAMADGASAHACVQAAFEH